MKYGNCLGLNETVPKVADWKCIVGLFLKGWRRKIAVVTLVTASLFMTAWARAQWVTDIVCVRGYENTTYVLGSNNFSLLGMMIYPSYGTNRNRTQPVGWWMKWTRPLKLFTDWPCTCFCVVSHLKEPRAFPDPLRSNPGNCVWDRNCIGFHIGGNDENDEDSAGYRYPAQMRYVVVPYLGMIVPLTFVSLWLLFSKPRSPKHAEPAVLTRYE